MTKEMKDYRSRVSNYEKTTKQIIKADLEDIRHINTEISILKQSIAIRKKNLKLHRAELTRTERLIKSLK